jgi:hypothetical protein
LIDETKNKEEDFSLNRYPNKEKLVVNALLEVLEDEDSLV